MSKRDTFRLSILTFCRIYCISPGYEFPQELIGDSVMALMTHTSRPASLDCPLDMLAGAPCNSTFPKTT